MRMFCKWFKWLKQRKWKPLLRQVGRLWIFGCIGLFAWSALNNAIAGSYVAYIYNCTAGETWKMAGDMKFDRCDGGPGPRGASYTYFPNKSYAKGYVPPGVSTFTVLIGICSNGRPDGGCPQGVSTRIAAVGGTWKCSGGEPWSDCIDRTVGPPILEAAFAPQESGSCLFFRDEKGQLWDTAYTSTNAPPCANSLLPPVTPDNCTVTTSDQWDISFGNVERSQIPTVSGKEEQKDITLVCTGGNKHDFNIKLNMTPTSWSSSQMVTSNPMLGIQVTVDGVPVTVGNSFTMSAQTQSSKTLGFSVLRNPAVAGQNIATGGFNASGTLVITEQ